MVTGDDNAVFLDTNILVYASIPESPLHLVALNAIQSLEQARRELWISRQVLREYLAIILFKIKSSRKLFLYERRSGLCYLSNMTISCEW